MIRFIVDLQCHKDNDFILFKVISYLLFDKNSQKNVPTDCGHVG